MVKHVTPSAVVDVVAGCIAVLVGWFIDGGKLLDSFVKSVCFLIWYYRRLR